MMLQQMLALILFNGFCRASDFKFLNPEPLVILAHLGSSVKINCTTTDPNATTSLWVKFAQQSQLKPDNSKVFQDGDVYTIMDIKNSDRGFYKCMATNALGDSISWTQNRLLHVLQPSDPQHTVSPLTRLIAVGESVNFTCEVNEPGQQVTLKWYKEINTNDFSPVATSQVDEQRTNTRVILVLMITKATASNQERDIFKCELTYGSNAPKNKYVTLTIRALQAPIVQSFVTSSINVKELQPWKVSCRVEGFHLPNITWLRDGQALPVCNIPVKSGVKCSQNDNYIANQTELTGWRIKSTLDIKSMQRPTGSDATNFTCLATNSLGSARKSVRVIIQGRPVIRNVKSNFLGTSSVYCEVEPIQPHPKIQWLYQKWHCDSHESVCVAHKNWESIPSDHSVTPPVTNLTLHSEVTIPDRIEEGFYKCTAKSSLGQDSHELVFSRHVVLIDADKTVLNVQDTLVIRCIHKEANFDGWAKDGRSLYTDSEGRVNVSKQVHFITLQVFNLTVNDSGVYSCMSRMPKGNASVEIAVKEIFKPKIISLSNQTSFKGNFSTVLFCNVSANPEASISWMKDDRSLTITQMPTVDCGRSLVAGYYQTKSNKYALVICHPSHKANSGRYRCTAKNRLGSESRDTYLNVLEFAVAEIANSPPNNIIKVALEDPVNVTCTGSGNPKPRVQWLSLAKERSDVSYKPDDSNPSQAILYIAAVEEKHFGNYSCFAKSFLGESEVFLVLQEKETLGATDDPPYLAIGLGVGFGVFLIIAIFVILCIYRYHNKQIAEYRDVFYSQGSDYQFDPKRTLLEQSSDLPYDPDWEFPEERLILGEVLDAGNFGQVYVAEAIGIVTFDARNKSAAAFKRRSTLRKRVSPAKINQDEKKQEYNRTTVAVKTLKADATGRDYQDLVSELKIMIHVGQHKNIINLLGACTRGKRLMLIIEFAPHGSLAKFLRKKREIYEPTWAKETTSPETEFTMADLAMEAYQVARGLEFLASRKCVHRDVAARNVLVSEGYVLKISDFGLARDVYKDDEYVKTTTGALPVKWMALESLYDKVYTEKSDVWSFGVLLWELFTLGGSPYPRIPTDRLIDSITEGYRMECPQNCPVEMYTLMRDCWLQIPEQRPTFFQIVDRIGKILEKCAAQASTTYISLLNDGQPSDYYLRPVDSFDPNVSNGAATALAGSSDTTEDFAHAPLPPIPISEFGYDSETTDKGRGQPENGTIGASRTRNCSVEYESGIDLEDSTGENDKLMDEGGRLEDKAGLNEPAIGLRNGQSKPRPGSRDAYDDAILMETTL